MKKFLFVLKTLCVCLCISSLILMVGVANLDTITKTDLFSYSACGIIAVAMFVGFKAIGKIERQREVIDYIDTELLKENEPSRCELQRPKENN